MRAPQQLSTFDYSQNQINEIASKYGYEPPEFIKMAGCRCKSNHRTLLAWYKCNYVRYESNGENSHKTTVHVNEWGGPDAPWAVYKRVYSGDYYTEHNGKRNNVGHYEYQFFCLDTQRDALNYYHKLKTTPCIHCDECSFHNPCENVAPKLLYVVRF
jgi:hypothetical protein